MMLDKSNAVRVEKRPDTRGHTRTYYYFVCDW